MIPFWSLGNKKSILSFADFFLRANFYHLSVIDRITIASWYSSGPPERLGMWWLAPKIFSNKYIQWDLDLRKILGAPKIILKSRFFFLFQTQETPWKSITLQNEYLKQHKCLISISLLNTSDYIFRYFHTLIRKMGQKVHIFF